MDLYKVKFLNQYYYLSSGEEEVVFDEATYTRSAIARTEMSLELKESDIRITVPMDLYPFTKFVHSAPSAELELTIIDYSTGFTLFIGILSNIKFKLDVGTAEAQFKQKDMYFDSQVPYRTYGTRCSFDLFSTECGLLEQNHSVLATVFSMDGSKKIYTIPSMSTVPDGTYNGGYVLTSTSEAIRIISQVGGTITCDFAIWGTPAYVKVVKGCDKAYATCRDKFGNSMRFGGFPTIPTKNPVTESI